ncbi:hypothetical protein KUTeg_014661 [Tegillarca granosa]|uniref:PX domain-containing protein n=1 Tax=Tegillarca granosa TaxID=220873 RepID=A0ABQ9EV08_TEGGR|nr:hypothetical protein KUTeg_014661 [Tegillarca granosa]
MIYNNYKSKMNSATVTIRELKNKDTGIDITVPTLKEIKGLLQSTFEFHLDEKYAATVLPMLPKKALIVNDVTARERRVALDRFMIFLSSTPKLCTSSILLEFLGVNAIKAGKFRKDENVMENVSGSKDNTSTDIDTEENKEPEPRDVTEESTSTQSLRDKTKLFEDQDFGGGINDTEEDLFLVPGAEDVGEKKQTFLFEDKDEEDDLLNNERPKPAPRVKPTIPQKPHEDSDMEVKGDNLQDDGDASEPNEAVKPKPAPRQKPKVPDRPKPKVIDKPKPKLPDKPKPEISEKPKLGLEKSSNKENVSSVDNLDTDDIMKYIQQNTSQNDDDDLDLFS